MSIKLSDSTDLELIIIEQASMTNSSKATKEVPDIDEKFELGEQLDNTVQMQAFWHDYPE